MNITSFAFNNNQVVPPRYKGATNPPLAISGVPDQAASLALVMHDPDGVSGDYIHWTLWDIKPTVVEILEDIMPSGAVVGINSSGATGYMGPRPPRGSGRHHYVFELYALDSMLDLLPRTPPTELIQHIKQHAIASAQLTGIVDA